MERGIDCWWCELAAAFERLGGRDSTNKQVIVQKLEREALKRAVKERRAGLEGFAKRAYPKKAGNVDQHHMDPKYLGGDDNGPTIALDSAYHQMITNAFRGQWAYGNGVQSAAKRAAIRRWVYKRYPL